MKNAKKLTILITMMIDTKERSICQILEKIKLI